MQSDQYVGRRTLELPASFFRALREWDAKYDGCVGLIKVPFSSPGYHTTLHGGDVHPTRESLQYAVACLDAGDNEHVQRACTILRTILPLQDTDPAHATYGIWSWFYEEPLTHMAPPDWNWADFCGAQLLQVWVDHRERIDQDLVTQIAQALRCACESIIRRNVTMGYTNIAIMGTYVTLVSGECMGWEDIRAYGRERLDRFYAFTKAHGLTEYNSPTYTRVAITELSRLRNHVQAADARAIVDDLHAMAWLMLARHYHAATRQWAGPHSRCYHTVQGEEFLSFLQWASHGRLAVMPENAMTIEIDWPRLGYEIPLCALPYFAPSASARTEVDTYVLDDTAGVPTICTTYMHPAFALGSINYGDCWNQRRPLIAYWGRPEAPSFLRLRLLSDGYDCSSGYLFTSQRDGDVLIAATLVTDNGNTHLSLDPLIDGRLATADLRVRVEIGGPAAAAVTSRPWSLADPVCLTLDGLALSVQVPMAVCAGRDVEGEILAVADAAALLHLPSGNKEAMECAALDLVLYRGERTTLDLRTLFPTVLGIGIHLGLAPTTLPAIEATRTEDTVTLQWALPEPLTLHAPIGPRPKGEMIAALSAR